MKLLMIVPVVVFAGLAGLFAANLFLGTNDELISVAVGKPAPEGELGALGDFPDLDYDMLRDGNVKIVNFWASWCAPCRVEHPNLVALAEEGIPIYGINYKDLEANAVNFLGDLGNPYTAIGTDDNGFYALDWGVYGVPETFLLAGDGTVLMRMAAPLTSRELEGRLRPALDAALEAE